MCSSRKYPYSPPTEGIGNSWGDGEFSKAQKFEWMYEAWLEFPERLGGLSKNPFHRGGIWIILEPHNNVFKVIHGITPVYIWLVFIGLAPETNLEKAFADMVVDAVMDVRAKIRKCRFETDAALKVNILINVFTLEFKFDALISIQSLWCWWGEFAHQSARLCSKERWREPSTRNL